MKILKLGYGEFQKGQNIGPASWPHYDLFTVHTGRVELSCEVDKWIIKSRSCVLIPPYCSFQGKTLSTNVLASIHHFDLAKTSYPVGFEHLQRISKLQDKPVQFNLSDTTFNDLNRSLSLQQNNRYEVQRASLLSLILSGLRFPPSLEIKSNHYDKLVNVLELMSNGGDTSYPVTHWASMANMSESHFRKEFKFHTGQSVVKYLNQLKIDKACQLLEQSDCSIQQVALQLGFEDMANFYRLFKQVTKQTPKLYRQSRRIWA